MNAPKKLAQIVQEREQEQGRKGAARAILTEVKDWRGKYVDIAKRRWIWELIQNAVDCGTREQRDVEIFTTLDDDTLVFEHNGGPFLPEELSALILGGSTKPFAPESPYAGRFGIGFLVTHILSLEVAVIGSARTEVGEEPFRLLLDRSGNTVDEILSSIKRCYQALDKEVEETIPKTRYVYNLRREKSKNPVIPTSELKKLLPYAMLFQERLKAVHIRTKSLVSSWEVQNRSTSDMSASEHLLNVTIKYTEESLGMQDPITEMINAIGIGKDDVTCAITVLDKGSRRTCLPNYELPRIFARYPLIGGTEKIGIPVVIGGNLEPSKDRDTVLLSDSEPGGLLNRRKIKAALGLIPKLLKYALDQKLEGVHHLLRVGRTGGVSEEYQQWWDDSLHDLVLELVNLDVVETVEGFKNPLDENLWFLVPLLRYSPETPTETEHFSHASFSKFWDFDEKMYSKANRVRKYIALDWQLNVRHWLSLVSSEELKGRIWSIERVCESFEKHEGEDLNAVGIGIDDLRKLVEIFDDTKDVRETAVVLLRDYPIMLNQNGKFTRGKELSIDNSIPESLKNIAESLEYHVLAELLNNNFKGFRIIGEASLGERDEDSLIDKIIDQIPPIGRLEDEKARAVASLLIWLTENKPDSDYVEKVPIVTSDGQLRYFAEEAVALLPLKMLDEGEHYEGVYPDGRLMADIYFELTNQTNRSSFVSVLMKKSIVHDSMLVCESSYKLGSKEMRSIVLEGEKVKGREHILTSGGGSCLQNVAFFNPDLIGALGGDIDRTRKFIRLLLIKLREASAWKNGLEVSCSCGKTHTIYPAIWLAHFKTKKWIPVRKEEEGEETIEPSKPNKIVMEDLFREELDDIVLDENGIELLKHLGFDQLDLKIRKAHIETNRPIDTIKTLLSSIVESGELPDIERLMGLDPETREALIVRLHDVEEKRKLVEANKEIGKLVEERIEEILSQREGVTVVPQYIGCDLKAYIRGNVTDDDVLQDLGHCILGPFYIEIKKTVGNRVRITKAQATLAVEKGKDYVLCVVKISSSKLTKENIEKHAILIQEIGKTIAGTTQPSKYVEPDINGYWIKSALWEKEGMTIDQWMKSVKGRLETPESSGST